MHVPYADIRRVWLEADEFPQLRDAWLWDHFLPLAVRYDALVRVDDIYRTGDASQYTIATSLQYGQPMVASRC